MSFIQNGIVDFRGRPKIRHWLTRHFLVILDHIAMTHTSFKLINLTEIVSYLSES